MQKIKKIIKHAGLKPTRPGMGEVISEDSLHSENDGLVLCP